jgi:hypothetical protein
MEIEKRGWIPFSDGSDSDAAPRKVTLMIQYLRRQAPLSTVGYVPPN